MIGAQIVEFDRGSEDRSAYGESLLDRLAEDLTGKKLKGCSRDMLERMRQFYLTYPQLTGLISASPMRKSGPRAPTPLPVENVLAFSWT